MKFDNSKSIKWVLLRTIVLFSTIPIFVFAIILWNNFYFVINKNIQTINLNATKGMYNLVHSSLEDVELLGEIISNNKELAKMNYIDVTPLINKIVTTKKSILQIGIVENRGYKYEEVINTGGSLNELPKSDYLEKAFSGESLVTNLLYHEKLRKNVVIMAKPIYKINYLGLRDGTISAVLILTLDLSYFTNIISSNDLGKGGTVFIVDSEGKIIAGSDNSVVDEKVFAASAPVQAVIKGKTGVVEYNYNNVNYIASYKQDQKYRWGIISKISKREAYSSLENLLWICVAILMVVVVSGIIISMIVSGRLVNPLTKLKNEMGRIEKEGINSGKIEETLLNRTDEIGILSKSFVSMIKEIEKAQDIIIKKDIEIELEKERRLSAQKLKETIVYIEGISNIIYAEKDELKVLKGILGILTMICDDEEKGTRFYRYYEDSDSLKLEIEYIKKDVKGFMKEIDYFGLGKADISKMEQLYRINRMISYKRMELVSNKKLKNRVLNGELVKIMEESIASEKESIGLGIKSNGKLLGFKDHTSYTFDSYIFLK